MIGVVIITHGAFGQEILRTAQDMVGAQDHVAAIALSGTMGSEGLKQLVQDTQTAMQGLDGVLYLVDMLGGTPCNVVLLQTRDRIAEVVTGINLYMLLSTFKNRGAMELKSLAVRVAEDGRKSIILPKELLAKKGV